MFNILEADYGIGPLRDVEHLINAGVRKLLERKKMEPWFDGLWMNEYGEVLSGALLVAAQAYCVGAVVEINEVRKGMRLKPLGKIEAYRQYRTARDGYSAIELVNAAANCFKHRDEWNTDWPDNSTTRTRAAFSITPATQFSLNQVLGVIYGDLKCPMLCDLLSEWRHGLLAQAKQED